MVARIVQAHNGQHTMPVHEELIARWHQRVPLIERMRPRRIIGQACTRISSLKASLRATEGSCLRFSCTLAASSRISLAGAIDVFGSFPDVVVDPRKVALCTRPAHMT